jgi:SAM-dependent methyltransferase
VAESLEAIIKPKSIIDVGCGQGIWLRNIADVFKSCKDLYAIDLSSNDKPYLEFLKEDTGGVSFVFLEQNLANVAKLPDREFDLIICLEVLEHLPFSAALQLIQDFAKKTKFLLFSAAVPGQGGTHHINEQSLAFWESELRTVGMVPFDFLRFELQKDKRVPSYYQNNIIFWVNKDLIFTDSSLIGPEMLVKFASAPLLDTRKKRTKMLHALLAKFPPNMVTFLAEVRSRIFTSGRT